MTVQVPAECNSYLQHKLPSESSSLLDLKGTFISALRYFCEQRRFADFSFLYLISFLNIQGHMFYSGRNVFTFRLHRREKNNFMYFLKIHNVIFYCFIINSSCYLVDVMNVIEIVASKFFEFFPPSAYVKSNVLL